jgi:protein TonB
VSRSMVLAFLIALIIHVLLAGVELDVFKGPLRVHAVPKALTVDLIKPMEKERPSMDEKTPRDVKKPEKHVIERSITKKLTPQPKQRVKPAITRKKEEIKKQKALPKEEISRKIEAPSKPPSSNMPREKEKKASSEREYAFVPDRVDVPTALPQRDDVSHDGDEDRSPPPSVDEPITVASPNYKENRPPSYPLLARRRSYEGTVILDVLVGSDGTVDSIKLAQSSGHETLDRAAIKSVRKWIFHPGKRGDEALEMWVTVPIRFQLK